MSNLLTLQSMTQVISSLATVAVSIPNVSYNEHEKNIYKSNISISSNIFFGLSRFRKFKFIINSNCFMDYVKIYNNF